MHKNATGKTNVLSVVRVLCIAAASLICAACSAGTEGKKILYTGSWNAPNTPQAFKNVEYIEKQFPFDGMILSAGIDVTVDGKKINFSPYWTTFKVPVRLTDKDIQPWIDAFSRLKFKKMTHNFLKVSTSLMNPDWFDDKSWEQSLHNYRMTARMAKKMGLKGICLDVEPYVIGGVYYAPLAVRATGKYTPEQTGRKIRERAAEWIKAVTAEFPDMTLFTFFWTGCCSHPRYGKTSGYAFLPEFINGVYDGAPETMHIVDGNEEMGYIACELQDYRKIVSDYYFSVGKYIAIENRAKFYRITSLATSLYLDSFWVGNGNYYNNHARSNNPTAMLETCISRSAAHAERYVWVYGERGAFATDLQPANRRFPDWNTRIPMVREAVSAGMDPLGAAKKYAGKKNMLRNGGFDSKDGKFTGWGVWHKPNLPPGKINAQNGEITVRDAVSTSLSQSIRGFKPGERYLFRVRARQTGKWQKPSIGGFFRNSRGMGYFHGAVSAPFGEPDAQGIREAALIIEIPADIDAASFLATCSVSGLRHGIPAGDSVSFISAEFRKIEYPWNGLKKLEITQKK